MNNILISQWLLVTFFLIVSPSLSLSAALYEGDKCLTSRGEPGVCTRLSSCPTVLQSIMTDSQQKHERCGFVRNQEIVCCGKSSSSSTQERKSLKACNEYRQSENLLGRFNIIGGYRTLGGQYPHMAALAYRRRGEKALSWVCGGTLISDRFVLTAAHCVTDRRAGPVLFVRLGVQKLITQTNADTDYKPEKVIVHPRYKMKFNYDDIALIKLSSKVFFSVEVFPACLGTQYLPGNVVTTATGWGATDPGATVIGDELLQVGLTTMDQGVCKSMLRPFAELPDGVADTMLCARDPDGEGDTCLGDSGGPLQMKNSDSITSTVVGVTSFGNTPCGGKKPSVYTRVSSYLDWIEAEVWP